MAQSIKPKKLVIITWFLLPIILALLVQPIQRQLAAVATISPTLKVKAV
jgi:hypothetical protein